MKYNLTDTSIIIHFRRDFIDRLNNLETIVKFLCKNFNYKEIIIINDDSVLDEGMLQFKNSKDNIIGLFYENNGAFRKADAFNAAAKIATGKILCFYDVDILIEPIFLEEAQTLILNDHYDHVYPHNGEFITVKKEVFDKILPTYDFNYMFDNQKTENFEWAAGNSPGGCNMISMEAFNKISGYDSRFLGWGFEDSDYKNRSVRKNRVKYMESDRAICWHLQHDNAIKAENPHYNHNYRIYIENNKG